MCNIISGCIHLMTAFHETLYKPDVYWKLIDECRPHDLHNTSNDNEDKTLDSSLGPYPFSQITMGHLGRKFFPPHKECLSACFWNKPSTFLNFCRFSKISHFTRQRTHQSKQNTSHTNTHQLDDMFVSIVVHV